MFRLELILLMIYHLCHFIARSLQISQRMADIFHVDITLSELLPYFAEMSCHIRCRDRDKQPMEGYNIQKYDFQYTLILASLYMCCYIYTKAKQFKSSALLRLLTI